MSEWIFFREVDFDDETILKFNIDTRDFCCGMMRSEDEITPLEEFALLLKKPDEYIHSKEELLETLNRLFEESGGEGEWRCLILDSSNHKGSDNWGLKYLRIFRYKHGFVVCNSENYALRKDFLGCPVNQELLNHINR